MTLDSNSRDRSAIGDQAFEKHEGTPVLGTAFDIVGQGKAKAEAMTQAFLLAAKMAAA